MLPRLCLMSYTITLVMQTFIERVHATAQLRSATLSISSGSFARRGERPNQKMEPTASRRYNLLFGGLNPYPPAMRLLARGSSSWFVRSMLRVAFASAVACMILASCATESALTSAAPGGISADHAYALGHWYMHRYVSLCGAAQEPILHGERWEVPLLTGQGAEPSGSVYVDCRTHVVSYRHGPKVTVESLDEWAKPYSNRFLREHRSKT
jgi:hypothetical protein